MADIVDIVVDKTEELVTIDVTTNETIVNITTQNGGGAVDSVNGQTGVVVLDADDISDSTTTNKFLTSTEKTNLINHLSNTSNPHSTTATQVDALQRDGSNANSNINIGEYELKAGQFTLDTTPTGTASVGTTRWNDTLGSTETTLKGGSVILKNGVDLVARVVNKVTPNATLTKAAYQAVRVSGAQGQRLAVAYAQANNDNNSADTIGIVCETIATNQEGFILTVGQLEGINTTGSLQGETWADGDVIYLSPTIAGALTNVKPTGATGHIVVIGYVEYAHAINGKLYIKIMNGWELDELHNVNISSPSNNQILAYTSSTSLWENKSVSTALGFTPIQLNSWVDYASTSTIVGFATITTRELRYLIIGNVAIYYFNIQGTSNSSTFTFTIHTNHNGNIYFNGSGYTLNNTTSNNPSRMLISNASNVITLAPALTGGTWSASGGKGCSGIFLIQL